MDYPVPIRRGRGQDSSPIPGSGTPAPGVTRGARAALGGSGFTAVNADLGFIEFSRCEVVKFYD